MSSDSTPGSINWEEVRSEFPALREWAYLNTATYGLISRRAQAATCGHFQRIHDRATTDFLSWFDDADSIRGKVAQLIHAQPEDIAFIPNAATGLSLLMANIQWEEGDEILTLENEFPNNTYYPALLALRGVTFREVPWRRFFESMTPNTKMVLLSSVNYLNGFRPPLDNIAAYLRQRNILLYVDGTQSVGALEMDVRRLEPDMLVVHGYKWMLSPSGAAFVYVRPRFRREIEPHVIGWRSDRNWRDMENLNHGAPELSKAAEKYEGGMIPFALLYALGASVDMMLELGPAQIEARVLRLAEQVRQRMRDLGASLASDEGSVYNSPIVAARFPNRDAKALASALKEKKIVVAARHGNLRIATHFYNNEEDLDRLVLALRSLL